MHRLTDKSSKYRLSILEGWLSLFANIILFGLKYWAGVVTGSVALIADAWHTVSDSISSVVLLVGLAVAKKPADKEHPFGHGRAELISSIIIGFILALIGFNFFRESVLRLMKHQEVFFGTIAIVVTAISIVVKEAMARFAIWAGKKEGIRSTIADGWHHRSDALSSVIILIGIFLGKFFWWIDGVLGLLVSLLIFYTAYVIIKDAADSLLGETPDRKLLKKIENIAGEVYPDNLGLHHFHIHRYGEHTEMTFHIVLPEEMELKEAGKLTRRLFERINNELNIIATIHIDTRSNYIKEREDD